MLDAFLVKTSAGQRVDFFAACKLAQLKTAVLDLFVSLNLSAMPPMPMRHTPLRLFALLLGCSASVMAVGVAGGGADELPLMPYPAQISRTAGALAVTSAFTLAGVDPALQLDPALADFRARLQRQTGLALQWPASDQPLLTLDVASAGPDIAHAPEMDERYTLTVDRSGIRLVAPQRFGALRGLQTLLQLVRTSPNGYEIPYVQITDAPRFAWRGLLLDACRHFIPVADIKRQIDGMAAARLNVLHWHLSDDQGWRIESTHYPRLQQLASGGEFYTRAQMADVVAYAWQRGIRVLPEVDMPGHATAIAVAYPELVSAPGPYQLERGWGVFKPTLDPSNPATLQFVDQIVGELTGLFPDPYFHIGGDEVDPAQWNTHPQILKFMDQHQLADAPALQAYFNGQLQTLLARHGRKTVGWDEIHHPDLPKSVVIQSWQGQDSLAQTAAEGYPGLLSTGFYLDQPQATVYHYRNEPLPPENVPDLTPKPGEQWQSWSFSVPRKKGGPVKGSFTLVVSGQKQWRGYIDFSGKARRVVHDIHWRGTQVTFWLDTWMGQTRPVLDLAGSGDGYFVIGNAAYAANLLQLPQGTPPEGIAPRTLSTADAQHIQGGEAALWAEIVDPSVLDLRLWPRTFAVAERLWSPASRTDSTSMYARLQVMDNWSAVSVGLQQHTQMDVALRRLAGDQDAEPLRILAEPVEQAQYYARLFEKFAAGHYNNKEALNRFADALPAESMDVVKLQALITGLPQHKQDPQWSAAISSRLQRWKNNVPAVQRLIDSNATLAGLRPVAENVGNVADAGLYLLAHYHSGEPVPAKERMRIQTLLQNAITVRDEVVVGAANPIRDLLWLTP